MKIMLNSIGVEDRDNWELAWHNRNDCRHKKADTKDAGVRKFSDNHTNSWVYIYTHIKLIKITTDLGRKENQTCLIKVWPVSIRWSKDTFILFLIGKLIFKFKH